MKALSFSRPWDYLILHPPFKNVENRKWPTRYRGRIYVHRAKSWDEEGFLWLFENRHRLGINGETWAGLYTLQCSRDSGIVGEVEITGVMRKTIDKRELRIGGGYGYGIPSVGDLQRELEYLKVHCPEYFSPWFLGPYGFVLTNPKAYETPIPYKGKLGLFEVELPEP